jgi:hypothetical protein
MNPALADTFGWLAHFSQLYERYRVRRFVVRYKPVVSATHAGLITLAFDYDALDAEPTSVTEMELKATKIVGNAREVLSLPIDAREIHKSVPWLYTKNSGTASHTTDFGRLIIAASGDAAAALGRLYVEYEIEFAGPTMEDAPTQVTNPLSQQSYTFDKTWSMAIQPWVANDVRLDNSIMKFSERALCLGHDRNGNAFSAASGDVYEVIHDFMGRVNMTFPCLTTTDNTDLPHMFSSPGILKRNPDTGHYATAGESTESDEGTGNAPGLVNANVGGMVTTFQDLILKKGDKILPGLFAQAIQALTSNAHVNAGAETFLSFIPRVVRTIYGSGKDKTIKCSSSSSSSSSSSTSKMPDLTLSQIDQALRRRATNVKVL